VRRSSWAFLFFIWLMFAPPQIMLIVLHSVCWILVGRLLLLRDHELVSSCNLVWLALVLLWWTGGEGCPSVLVRKSDEPIAFDSRLGVSSLVQVWFWAFFGFLSVDQWLRGGRSWMIFRSEVAQLGWGGLGVSCKRVFFWGE